MKNLHMIGVTTFTVFVVSILLTTILAFILAKNKSFERGWAGFFGFLCGFFPPFNIVYLIVIWLKK